MREKLRNSRGETLVEVLVSVLVCALSITLLAGAVTASANIDLRARRRTRNITPPSPRRSGRAGLPPAALRRRILTTACLEKQR